DVFLKKSLDMVTSVRTTIGQSRRGGEVRENEAALRVELIPYSDRSMSLNEAFEEWGRITKGMSEFKEIKFLKDRFGSQSGSAIVIEVQENNDVTRKEVLDHLQKLLKQMPFLVNVEVENPLTKSEYRLHVKEEEVSKRN